MSTYNLSNSPDNNTINSYLNNNDKNINYNLINNDSPTSRIFGNISNFLKLLNFSRNSFDFSNILLRDPKIALQLLSNSDQDLAACLGNCSNNGNCQIGPDLKLQCVCFDNYTGSSCKTNTRPCSYYPCLNAGFCEDLPDSSFNCSCSYPYYGIWCENKKNVCQNFSCNNNGYCYDNSSEPSCNCYDNYNGKHCENQDPQLKKIKAIISIASVVAILCLVCFYLSFFIMDISKIFFSAKSNLAKMRKSKPIKNNSTNNKTNQTENQINMKIKYVYKNLKK